MNILIAEDDLTSRSMLACVLKNCGHDVVETVNGEEAWEALQQADPPRLAILDWMMPKMDGAQVLRLVREVKTDRPTYVIMLTAKGEKDDIISGLKDGANDYLVKPFDSDELLARVDVGLRMVDMQRKQHEQRAYAQSLRVEVSKRMGEMQDALAAKANELRRVQAELHALSERQEAVREDERRTLANALNDTFGLHLNALEVDLNWLDHHLKTAEVPDLSVYRDRVTAMVRRVQRLTEQTEMFCASLHSEDRVAVADV